MPIELTVHRQVKFARIDGILDEIELSLGRMVVAASDLCVPRGDAEDNLWWERGVAQARRKERPR